MIPALLSGIGLSASAGLNAWLPLLILALADIATGKVDLESPWSFISSVWGILIILVLLPIELFADKIPKLDSLSDRIHLFIRPVAGVVAMLAIWSDGERFNPWLGLVIAALVAGFVHAFKARIRPLITKASRGIANPFVSIAEDAAAIIVSILAVFLPWSMLIVLPLFGFLLWRMNMAIVGGKFNFGPRATKSAA